MAATYSAVSTLAGFFGLTMTAVSALAAAAVPSMSAIRQARRSLWRMKFSLEKHIEGQADHVYFAVEARLHAVEHAVAFVDVDVIVLQFDDRAFQHR